MSGLAGVPVDLVRWGERILTGTGLSLADAAAVAASGTPPVGVPDACAGALRDGWVTAFADVELEAATLPEPDAAEGGEEL